MTTTLKIAGQFRVKPGSGAAFAKLVEDLDLDEWNVLELGENDMVVLGIDEEINHGSYGAAMDLLDRFVADYSVLGAAVLQTGDGPDEWDGFGPEDVDPLLIKLANRDYFTWHRDYWQEQLDQLEAP